MGVTDKSTGFLFGFITCALCAAGIWAWSTFKPSLPAVLGEAPAKFADAKTETVPCKTLQALAPKAKKDVGLPAAVQKDEDTSLLAVAKVPRSDNPLWASAVLHRSTGIGEIYFTPQPTPWLAFNRRWRFGGYYGINDQESGVIMGTAQYEFLQLKRLKATAIGQVDSSSRWFGGVGVTW